MSRSEPNVKLNLSSRLSFGEEVANTITHGVASFIVLCALPLVAITAYIKGSLVDVVGVTIFSISIFMMFLASTLYHAMEPDTKHKKIMRILDHIFIYVAIAGTYTPIALSIIKGWQSIVILVIQWSMVIFGILYKSISKSSIPKVSLLLYLIMGWTLVIFMPLLKNNANPVLFWTILLGGIFYTAGAVIYSKKGFRYHHMVWHLFVFLGAFTHFVGICFFMY